MSEMLLHVMAWIERADSSRAIAIEEWRRQGSEVKNIRSFEEGGTGQRRAFAEAQEPEWRTRAASRRIEDIPFEFVGQIAGASTVAEASDVESGAATGHVERFCSCRR